MSDVWSRMEHWDLVLPPSRPDVWQLAVIRRIAAQLDRAAPVGVLGSTPEFLDLLLELGFRDIRAFERNPSFHARLRGIRTQPCTESVVVGDWLDSLPASPGDLQLLLSDLTMGNIAYERRADFYAGIRGALANGGYFVDKVLRHPGPHLLLTDLASEFEALPVNLSTVNRFSSEALFCSELLDLREGLVDSTLFYGVLAQRMTSPRLQAFIRRAELITPREGLWYYGRPWHLLEAEYCRGLDLLETIEDLPDSAYSGRVQLRVYRRDR